ncbi:MAG: type IV toxin-antitoxin system AbiEi family antitoxin domain-containing protein [Actinomycetes bacterium]
MSIWRQGAVMASISLLSSTPLLGPEFPLPLDRPFTTGQAAAEGVSRAVLARLHRDGLVRRMLKGVYVATQAADGLLLRAQALNLVVPEGTVVVDWTAMWLHTGMLPFGQHREVPPVSLFRLPGQGRLRNELCVSGERALIPEDLTVVSGLVVTTELRTAWDLGRFSSRDDAIGGLDRLLRTGAFTRAELLAGVERFRRQRGVVQLRDLAPRADPRSQSGPESVTRLRWTDLSSLPPPTPQVPIHNTPGGTWWLDLGIDELRFAVEYDGEEFHSDDADRRHDRERRDWIRQHRRWIIEPVRRHNLFGPTRDIERILIQGVHEARRTLHTRLTGR